MAEIPQHVLRQRGASTDQRRLHPAHGEQPSANALPPGIALARGFVFVVFEQLPEVGNGRLIRKVAAIPRDFSMRPANPPGTLAIGAIVFGAAGYFGADWIADHIHEND